MRDMAAHQQGFPSEKESIAVKDISVVEIIDPYNYVSSGKIIAFLKIKGPRGEQIRTYSLERTKKGRYLMT